MSDKPDKIVNVPSWGKRNALRDHMDNARASLLDSRNTHRIDLIFAKSPDKGILTAGIFTYTTFRQADEIPLELQMEGYVDPEGMAEMEVEPELIRDPDRTKAAQIIGEFLTRVGKHFGKAEARVVCPGLNISKTYTSHELVHLWANPEPIHELVKNIYSLIDKGYTWDARERAIVRRRGREFAQTPTIVTSKK
jgi:hypothetical protein